jgi:hypothetical protein
MSNQTSWPIAQPSPATAPAAAANQRAADAWGMAWQDMAGHATMFPDRSGDLACASSGLTLVMP